jgi:hypothetical protein
MGHAPIVSEVHLQKQCFFFCFLFDQILSFNFSKISRVVVWHSRKGRHQPRQETLKKQTAENKKTFHPIKVATTKRQRQCKIRRREGDAECRNETPNRKQSVQHSQPFQ